MSGPRKCCFVKPDGTACRANAIASGDYCFFHAPDRAEARKAAGGKGGRRGRKRPVGVLPKDAEDVALATVADVTNALAATFNQVRSGQLDAKTGNCLGLLAGQLLRALQEGELAAEMEAQAGAMEKLRASVEEMRHERRHAKNAVVAAANGVGRAARVPATESAPRSGPSGPSGDPEPGGDDAGSLANDLAPFLQ